MPDSAAHSSFSFVPRLSVNDRQRISAEIRRNGQPDATFFAMNALAALVAGYGLLADSTAVVIGAMLVAMMLGPLAASGMALVQRDGRLIRQSLLALLAGAVMIVGLGMILGWWHDSVLLGREIRGRTSPNLFDLMVAIFGGLAGALAAVNPRLSVAVVGVGVATALVPPLVAAGILFAHERWREGSGALLLALTNMVAIQLTSSLVLFVAGFGSGQGRQAGYSGPVAFIKNNLITLILLLVLGTYLTISLNRQIRQKQLDQQVESVIKRYLQVGNNVVVNLQLLSDQPVTTRGGAQVSHVTSEERQSGTLARVVIRGDQMPLPHGLTEVERHLPPDPEGQRIRLQVRFVPVQIINPLGTRTRSLSEEEADALAVTEK